MNAENELLKNQNGNPAGRNSFNDNPVINNFQQSSHSSFGSNSNLNLNLFTMNSNNPFGQNFPNNIG
jgi:hypothetical protein